MDRQMLDRLKDWRRQTLDQVQKGLVRATPISVSWDEAQNRYHYYDEKGQEHSLPTDAGVYVFYSNKTHRPVYVGQAGDLKSRLGHHCRVSGTSVFKRRWVRHWIGAQATEEEVVRYIHSRTYFKYVVLPFGRCEIETDLLGVWELTGPRSVALTDI